MAYGMVLLWYQPPSMVTGTIPYPTPYRTSGRSRSFYRSLAERTEGQACVAFVAKQRVIVLLLLLWRSGRNYIIARRIFLPPFFSHDFFSPRREKSESTTTSSSFVVLPVLRYRCEHSLYSEHSLDNQDSTILLLLLPCLLAQY